VWCIVTLREIRCGNFVRRLQYKTGREDTRIFKPTTGNERLCEITNDNGAGVVTSMIPKNQTVKNAMFPHYSIHKYTWVSPDGKTHNQIDHVLIDKRRHSNIFDVPSFRGQECVELYLHYPNTPPWRGVRLKKHRDNSYFLPIF